MDGLPGFEVGRDVVEEALGFVVVFVDQTFLLCLPRAGALRGLRRVSLSLCGVPSEALLKPASQAPKPETRRRRQERTSAFLGDVVFELGVGRLEVEVRLEPQGAALGVLHQQLTSDSVPRPATACGSDGGSEMVAGTPLSARVRLPTLLRLLLRAGGVLSLRLGGGRLRRCPI